MLPQIDCPTVPLIPTGSTQPFQGGAQSVTGSFAHLFSGGSIERTLARLAADGADAGQIADEATAVWNAVDRSLSPVIGHRGSTALLQRSIHLVRERYPWLDGVVANAMAERDEFATLRSALAGQTPAHAAAAHDSILQTFLDLLADLIGESLTQRLLREVWEPPSSGHAVKDTSP